MLTHRSDIDPQPGVHRDVGEIRLRAESLEGTTQERPAYSRHHADRFTPRSDNLFERAQRGYRSMSCAEVTTPNGGASDRIFKNVVEAVVTDGDLRVRT